jgi:hypothetical protein
LRGMTSSLRILSNLAFVSHPTIWHYIVQILTES